VEGGLSAEFGVEPSAGCRPIAFNGSNRDAKYFANFFLGKPGKEAEFHNLALAGVPFGKEFQGIVESDELRRAFFRKNKGLIERKVAFGSAALAGAMSAGIIDQDATHETRGNAEKVIAVFPGEVFLLEEADECLMNEACGLKGVIFSLAAHVIGREASEVRINEGNQFIGRSPVALLELSEDTGNLSGRRLIHGLLARL
jgi:hypothetical protein